MFQCTHAFLVAMETTKKFENRIKASDDVDNIDKDKGVNRNYSLLAAAY